MHACSLVQGSTRRKIAQSPSAFAVCYMHGMTVMESSSTSTSQLCRRAPSFWLQASGGSGSCLITPVCGAHGTINAACGCDCQSGWASVPNQDPTNTVYCAATEAAVNEQISAAQGNPSTGNQARGASYDVDSDSTAYSCHAGRAYHSSVPHAVSGMQVCCILWHWLHVCSHASERQPLLHRQLQHVVQHDGILKFRSWSALLIREQQSLGRHNHQRARICGSCCSGSQVYGCQAGIGVLLLYHLLLLPAKSLCRTSLTGAPYQHACLIYVGHFSPPSRPGYSSDA